MLRYTTLSVVALDFFRASVGFPTELHMHARGDGGKNTTILCFMFFLNPPPPRVRVAPNGMPTELENCDSVLRFIYPLYYTY